MRKGKKRYIFFCAMCLAGLCVAAAVQDGQPRWDVPTQSLAARWLREKHGIHIAVTPSNKAWYWELRTTDGAFMAGSAQHNPTFPTYEEALETGLREALEHIINQPKQHEYETRND